MCLPGLSRNARDFHVLAKSLSTPDEWRARRVIVVESRGRGRSGWADKATYNVIQELDDLLVCLDSWKVGSAQFVGTSRGGLVTMLLAMKAPERIDRVVLNDIGPTIERNGLARIASGIGVKMHHESFEALADHLSEAQGTQFPRMPCGKWIRYAEQLATIDPEGGVVLDFDPALAETVRGYSPDDPAPDFWPGFQALDGKPVMVVRGAYSDLLSAATVEAMRRRHRDLATLVVPDEGHAPLLWDRLSIETISTFLS
ncbi:alpha/beta fold hydrolase [Acuticoccus sediminis]|uniref:alpha/beta fold hydrolase n=1 Tax=Acuticoccus sediminis TaxID=2184697 RepID=UPI001CFE9A01|nr:alpha/beta hydrolase [Acuticoccus sediminis]